MRAHLTDDVDAFLAATGEFLAARPVEHNLMLSLAHQARDEPRPSRWAWVTDIGGAVAGALIQAPATFVATVTPMPAEATRALVEPLVEAAPELPGVNGEAATAARFAGAWASERQVPAHPREGQRLYRLGRLTVPDRVPGGLRRAVANDVDRLVAWREAFADETGMERPAGIDWPAMIARRVREGRFWVWEADGAPVSMAFATPPAAGASRIGAVYTPPDLRGRGYAGACVGHLSAALRDSGAPDCLLYTQLSNPTSNRIYQRLGYEPVAEVLSYRFGGAS
ncbi:MAG TPA: GNAT family N-acetyltransferase [Acidimicrobiales bacterium]|nr:GNAT family N-acetyltransferase [Acidimicrobiales bacterium]